ncbi:DUF6338 family protein [uncultured Clostridium sp.]|uniref:DUF6338 family protein n=1 Tax=uncultured Clostridium sp. TaxID=59620 RepID=UPI00258B886A|nr:DUF6338 family protein [uncultured Clostridium sp.]
MIENFDMFFYTMTFVVPGFIIYYLTIKFYPQKTVDATSNIIKYMFYSSLNFAVISPIVYFIVKSDYHKQHVFRTAALWMVAICIVPIILGIINGIANQKGWIKEILNVFNVNPIIEIPTAWDYKFSSINEATWIIVTTMDNVQIMGLYSTDSFASSELTERDLYLEKYYTRNVENTDWEEVLNKSILIKAEQIKFLEFCKE